MWRGHGICPLCYKTRILMSCSKNLAGNERVRETFGLLSVEMHAQEIGLVTPSQSRSISSIYQPKVSETMRHLASSVYCSTLRVKSIPIIFLRSFC